MTANSATGQVGVFDTDASPPTEDDDLLVGSGNAIVINEIPNPPPDDDANGGTLNFSGFSRSFTLLSFDIIDLEEGESVNVWSGLNGSGDNLGSFAGSIDGADPNTTVAVTFADLVPDATGLTEFSLVIDGTVAIDNVSYVPLPAAAWMFIAGLAGVAGVVRHQRRRPDATAA